MKFSSRQSKSKAKHKAKAKNEAKNEAKNNKQNWLLSLRTKNTSDLIYISQPESNEDLDDVDSLFNELHEERVRNGKNFQGVQGRFIDSVNVSPVKIITPTHQRLAHRIADNRFSDVFGKTRRILFFAHELNTDAQNPEKCAKPDRDVAKWMLRPKAEIVKVSTTISKEVLSSAHKQKRGNLNQIFHGSATSIATSVHGEYQGRFEHSHTLAHSHGGNDRRDICVASYAHNSLRLASIELLITMMVRNGMLINYVDIVKHKRDSQGELSYVAESETMKISNSSNRSELSIHWHNPCAMFNTPMAIFFVMQLLCKKFFCSNVENSQTSNKP
jgi:hypothetical protein